MSRPSHSSLVIACLCLAFGALAVSAQDRSDTPKKAPDLKVGVVDIGVLFKSYKRKDTLEEEINKKREEITGELKKKAEKIQDMRKRLDKGGLREGSEPWMRAMRDIEIAQYRLKLEKDHKQNSLKKDVERQTLQILNELRKTIAHYGKAYKYDLILKIDNEGRGGGDKEDTLTAHFQEAIFRAQISDVLYFNENKLDITENVQSLLNKPSWLRKMARESKAPK